MISDAYAAGFIDGEGSIGITRSLRPRYAVTKEQYAVRIAVGNTYKPILDMLVECYGGQVVEKRSHNPWSRKPMYHWLLTGSKAIECLRKLYPHLVEKRERAWLALEFACQITKGSPGKALPREEQALREGFWLATQASMGNMDWAA
mgnify:CR=1 FL=1